LGRYAVITDRLRALTSERLTLLYAGTATDKFRMERLRLVDLQLPNLMRHHKKAHDAVVAIYSAVVIFVADMFRYRSGGYLSGRVDCNGCAALFLAGTAVLLLGALTAALEIRTSHQALHEEVMRVASLGIGNRE